MNEEWKDVKGYKGLYQISNFGKIRSLDRIVKTKGEGKKLIKGVYLYPSLDKNGYIKCTLSKDDKRKHLRLHRIVADHFIEKNKNHNLTVNHKDGNKLNNNSLNLEWCTSIENINHAFKIGLRSSSGEKNPKAKLTKDKVIQIRTIFENNIKKYKSRNSLIKELSNKFNVSISTISHIIYKNTWSNV